MAFVHGHELRTDQSLTRQSLTSGNNAFTLVHQDDGNLVLYRNGGDRAAIWSSGTYGTAAGRTVLQADGNLVVDDADGTAVWASGTDGLPATRLVVRDYGDVVLTGDDGQEYWHTDTATPRPEPGPVVARGDRMERGESLTRQSITSPNGRYVFVHQDDGNTVLYRDGGPAIWAENQFHSGSSLILTRNGVFATQSPDGRLVTRSGLQGEQLIVRDDGNVVLVDQNGKVVWATGTSDVPPPTSVGDRLRAGTGLASDQSLTSPNGEFEVVAGGSGELVVLQPGHPEKTVRWRGSVPDQDAAGTELVIQDDGDLVLLDVAESGAEVRWHSATAKDWLAHLGIEEAHCVTFVRGVDEREALIRLGAPPEAIRPMTWAEVVDLSYRGGPGDLKASAAVVRYGEWLLLVEVNGSEGTSQALALSADGGEVAATYLSVNYDQYLVYARDGVQLAGYDEGAPQDEDFDALAPYVDQVGRERFEYDEESEDLERADLSLVLAIAGVQPKPGDFDGPMPAAVWETPLFARLREAMAARRTASDD